MAPSSASGSGKRKYPYDNSSSPIKRQNMHNSPEPADVDAALMNEVVYDGSKEPFPQRPAYDKGLYDLYRKNHKLVKSLLKVLDKHSSVSKELQNMQWKAQEAMKLPVPERVMVALVGSTAAGKSSVACRLSDEPDLAKELSAGESCTSVPMLYMNKLVGQTSPYAAEIQYYTIPKCRELLEESLRQYNFYTFEQDADWTNKQRNEYAQQASTAFQIFRTLFRDRVQFISQKAAESQLAWSYEQGSREELLEEMVGWCEDFFEDFDKEDGAGITRCEAGTMIELRDQIDPLTAPNHFNDESSLWPLVQKVCVGIPSSRVFQYITLVDLPGITDTNKLRVDTTHDYIRKCQALWYVADVARICDDPNLEETLCNYAERFRGTFAIIATKIDLGISHALALDMKNKGQSVGDYYEAKSNIDEINARLKRIRRAIKTATTAQKAALRDEQEELEDSLKEEETRKMDSLVDARTSNIETRLRWDKQKHLPEGAALPIHFVSNPQYDMHVDRDGDENPNPKFGSIKDTGIPGLRAYALSLASPGVWEAYTYHLMFIVRVLFNGVYGWAQDSPMKRQAGLMDVVNNNTNLWTVQENETIDKMAREFDLGIIQRLRVGVGHSYQGVWKHFETICSKPWWPNSFLAFFRNDGKHSTKAIGSESWNEQFIGTQTRDVLNPAWKEALPQPENYFDEPIDKLMKNIEELPETLGRMPGSVPLPINSFRGVLDAQVFGIEAAHNKHKQHYTQALANIKLDATLDQYTGHFAQAMQPCYSKGKDDKGLGVCTRHKNRLHNHLSRNDPIAQATELLSEALKDNVNKHARALRGDLDKILLDITHQFELILEREAETSREKLARRELQYFLDGAMPGINRIDSELNAIKQRYSGL